MAGQPIQRFIETAHDEWAEEEAQVEVGEHALRLTAADLPSEEEEKKRKVVVIHEMEETPSGLAPQLTDPLARVKEGLAWLYKQKMGTAALDVLRQLAVHISEMERLSEQSEGENGRSDQPQTVERPEPPIEARVTDKVDASTAAPIEDKVEPTIKSPAVDKVETPIEAQIADSEGMPIEPQIDIAERLPSHPPEHGKQAVEERVIEKNHPPADKFQSGLLQKHLDTKPKEENAELEQVVEDVLADKSSASDSDEALETLQETLDGEISAEGTEDQLTIEEDFFENLEKELSFDGGDDGLELVDAPPEKPVPSPSPEGSKTKDGSWPPRRPSEMNDFEEYK
jgi:hypothetical protein